MVFNALICVTAGSQFVCYSSFGKCSVSWLDIGLVFIWFIICYVYSSNFVHFLHWVYTFIGIIPMLNLQLFINLVEVLKVEVSLLLGPSLPRCAV